MKSDIWTEDTLLDISVNVVPMVVLVAFVVLFLGATHWGMGLSLLTAVMFALIVVMGVILAYVTYLAAVKIEG